MRGKLTTVYRLLYKKEILLLLVILLVGAFLRLYRISEYMTFLGDEGRDVLVVRRLLLYADPILVGPGTSIGNMYLGPLYYYMMAPALFLANFSPVGPAVMVAILGVTTIFLVWFVTREWFGEKAALLAAFFYAIAPTVIINSRSSWNPNIMPFFALLAIYAGWRVWQKLDLKWLLAEGIAFAFVLQSHYLGLILVPVLVFPWLLSFQKVISHKQSLALRTRPSVKRFISYSAVGLGIFLILMSPLVIFDARHGWRNFSAMKDFFSTSRSEVSVGPSGALLKIPQNTQNMVTRLLAGRNTAAGKLALGFMGILLVWFLFIRKEKYDSQKHSAYLTLGLWLTMGILGLSLYRYDIFDHYMGFLFPAPFILLGGLINEALVIRRWGLVGKIIVYCLVPMALLLLLIANLADNPLRYPPNRQMQRSQEIAAKIKVEANGKPLNLATISEMSNRDVYQYFLLQSGADVVDTDPQRVAETVTDQLFVVCEKPKATCDPVHDPSAWITNFGWSRIDATWDVAGVTLYKLGHAN